MKLSRHTLMASVLLASGMVVSLVGSAHAQRAVYRTVSGHGYGHGCPCPADCPEAAGEAAAEEGTEDGMGEDLPEVADLTSDASFASASQSAAPNAIGDSGYPGIYLFNNGAILPSDLERATLDPAGRRFKATHNNSAVPQSRVFFNYNYFNNGLFAVANNDAVQSVNPQSFELGAEYAFWCDMASVQVRVPMNYGFENDVTEVFPLATGTEFGNLQVALKTVLCQDACTTWTAGLGFDLPTSDDLTVTDFQGANDLVISNDVVTISPYLATLKSLGCDTFAQAFAQLAIPLSETNVVVENVATGDYTDPTLLYIDLSVGKWLNQDCCGNGILALAELHYTNALDGDAVTVGDAAITVGDYEMLNATLGVSLYRNCWVITPAIVLPILDDAVWDYEFALQVNRRF